MNKKTIIVIAAIVAVLAIGSAVGIAGFSKRYEHQLELGYKYFEEGKYEEAILAFDKAIEIEPKRYEAYLALADAYIANGQKDKAISLLEDAMEITNSKKIAAKLKKLEGKKRNLTEMTFTNFSATYTEGSGIIEHNEGAVGGMDLAINVSGPSNVADVMIAQWQPEAFTMDEINECADYYEEIWKDENIRKPKS